MSFVLTALIMFLFWILLSGEINFVLIFSGIISSLLVSYMSHNLLTGSGNIKLGLIRTIGFIRYLPWLLWQIILANVDMVYRTLHPKMPISPKIIRFKNDFKTDLAMVTFANSITLTPGTVTINVTEDEFIVHSIVGKSAKSLISGEMKVRTKRIEGEHNV